MLKKLTLIILMITLTFILCNSASAADTTIQININATGSQPNGGSLNPAISADGNYAVYSSDASNLVPNDTNGKSDIFVYNKITNQTYRVSVDSTGAQSNGNSYNPSINSNGRYIVFDSVADNLVPLDTNRCSDIFIHDMLTGTMSRIIFNSTVLQLNGNSYNPSISGDGRYIAYEFYNTILAGSNGPSSIYLYDRLLCNTTIISSGYCTNPVVSADGTHVAYQAGQIYLYNILTNETIKVSVDPYGNEGNGPSFNPSININGTIIAFQSNANNLCPGDTAGNSDIFVHNTVTGMTSRVSVNSNGEQANGASVNPSISGNGLYVTYYSFANNLVEGDTNGVADVFFYNMSSGKTSRISVDSNNDQFSFGSYFPVISTDGNYVVFLSKPGTDSNYEKVLVHDCTWNVNANLASGAYYSPQTVSLSANTGVNIFYTTDGSAPTTASTPYTGPIAINTSQTLKYIALNGVNQSPINTRTYQIYAWEPYSYQVTVAYRLSNKKYRIKYTVPYTAKKRIRTKIGKKWRYSYIYVTKYKVKYRWDYRYGYRTETRWANHWVLK